MQWIWYFSVVASLCMQMKAFPSAALQPNADAFIQESESEIPQGAVVTVNSQGAPAGWTTPQIEQFNDRGSNFQQDLHKLAQVFAEEPDAARGVSGEESEEDMFGPSLKEYLTGNATESSSEKKDKIRGMEDTIKKAKQIQKKMPGMEKKLQSMKSEFSKETKAEQQEEQQAKVDTAKNLKNSIDAQIKELQKQMDDLKSKKSKVEAEAKGGGSDSKAGGSSGSSSGSNSTGSSNSTASFLESSEKPTDRNLDLGEIRNILSDLKDLV